MSRQTRRLHIRDLQLRLTDRLLPIGGGNAIGAESSEPTVSVPAPRWSEPRAQCALCFNQKFPDVDDQRAHFRSDWHLYNIKRKLRNEPPVEEEQFEAMVEADDVSSISGSESDDHEPQAGVETADVRVSGTDVGDSLARREPSGPRAEFEVTGGGGFVQFWRAVLVGDPSRLHDPVAVTQVHELIRSVKESTLRLAILMYGGGHFCGVVFDGKGSPMVKKSKHRYTTRRGQGGNQFSNDKAARAKSAGATMRRHWYAVLRQEVRDTIRSWTEHLTAPDLRVFVRVPNQERDVFFGFDESPLDSKAVFRIPFTTRRATFEEVKRVYAELLTVVSSPIPLSGSKTLPLPNTGSEVKMVSSPRPQVAPQKARSAVSRDGREDQLELLFTSLCLGKRRAVAEMSSPDVNMVFGAKARWKKGKRKVNGEGMTPLEVCALLGHVQLVEDLLEKGADPVLNKPYGRAPDKDTRNAFRRFWHRNPDLFDYKAGGIPSPLTPEMEEKEKQKNDERERKAREQAEEQLREEQAVAQASQDQARSALEEAKRRERAKPSQREKRAMAAEVRAGLRCAQCYVSLTGLVPFDKMDAKYCSMGCVTEATSRQR